MTRAAVLTSHLTTGDAVSNDVLGMYDALWRHGHDARLFAGGQDFTEPRVWPADEITEFLADAQDILIYHHSIGWDIGLDIFREASCRTVIKYHNVTPPHFFEGISQWHMDKCREGRERLTDLLLSGCDLYLADSEYNRQELIAAGAEASRSFIVPPFHHIDRLNSIDADLAVLDSYRDGKTNLLMVGRVAPHKGHLALIEAFAIYHHVYNSRSRLLIVGKEEEAFKAYSTQLRELLAFLLLEDAVVFVGEVSDEALKSCYLLSSAFVLASEHEGFCVPLVEAMAMRLPVVAYASSAIPGTAGDGGLVLTERDPRLMAESLNLLVRDEATSVALGLAGWRRYEQQFTNRKIESQFLEALGQLG